MELSVHLVRAETDAVRAAARGGTLSLHAGRSAVFNQHDATKALVVLPLREPPFTDLDDDGQMQLRATDAIARTRGQVTWFCLRDGVGRCLAHGSAGIGTNVELKVSHATINPGDRVKVDEVAYQVPTE